MVSKRKAKKLAKQEGVKNQKPPNPNGVHSGDVTGADPPKSKPTDAKHIIGFGQKDGKASVHAISNVDNSALCDHRQKGFAVVKELTTKDCTCKSCQKFGVFKNLVELEKKTVDDVPPEKKTEEVKPKRKDPERVAEEVATAADKKAKVDKSKVSDLPPSDEKPKPEPTKEKAKVDEDEDDFAGLKNLIDIRFKRLETRLTKKLHAFIDDALLRKPEFFLIQNMTGKYGIVHESSRLVIVDNILETAAKEMLPKFLDIVYKWNGQDKMPKEWVTAIKDIIEKEMPKAKAELAKADKPRVARKIKRRKPAKAEPKRKLKRRAKEPKRTIKRRSRH
jgi:hypothetical protein